MRIGDGSWVAAVRAACDPVFDQADAGFAFNAGVDSGAEVVTSLLWEANPRRFIERYPDSDILDSYDVEDADEITCLDFWVNLEGDGAQISTEGWDHLDVIVPLTGNGGTDGPAPRRRLRGPAEGQRRPGVTAGGSSHDPACRTNRPHRTP